MSGLVWIRRVIFLTQVLLFVLSHTLCTSILCGYLITIFPNNRLCTLCVEIASARFFSWYQSARLNLLCYRQAFLAHRWRVSFRTTRTWTEVWVARSSLSTEKLERSNYNMHQYQLGHGYWSYVEGANDATPDATHIPTWEQATMRIMYGWRRVVRLRKRVVLDVNRVVGSWVLCKADDTHIHTHT